MRKFLIVIMVFFTPTIFSASFDCSKAKLPAEIVICNDSEISKLDEEIVKAYEAVIKKGGSNELKESQRIWLRKRNDCGTDASCLKRLYVARISELKGKSVHWETADWKKSLGKWTEVETTSIYGQWLTIQEITDVGFKFDLNAISGAHTGEINGFAKFIQDVALFKSDENNCQLEFIPLDSESIKIETSGDCWYYGGMGISFGGKFLRGIHEKTLSLIDWEILKTKAEDQAFRKLVGKEYKDFVERFQLSNEDNKDLDGLGTRVVTGGVRGMFTYMEAILMDGPGDKIYAAMLKDERVEYFTNDKAYARRLPKTIDAWRQRFASTPVFFMTAK